MVYLEVHMVGFSIVSHSSRWYKLLRLSNISLIGYHLVHKLLYGQWLWVMTKSLEVKQRSFKICTTQAEEHCGGRNWPFGLMVLRSWSIINTLMMWSIKIIDHDRWSWQSDQGWSPLNIIILYSLWLGA